MEEKYNIAYSGGENEITEKKSRFIAALLPVKSEEEALLFIESMKKKYRDAAHNCYAYVIGDQHQITRCSDDGEPSGTAGKPMLDVLLGEDIHDIAVVVTRYFGGTLLGTGGLIRAYTGAVKAGLNNCKIVMKCPGKKYTIQTDYNGLGKLQYLISQMELILLDTSYMDMVLITVLVPEEVCAAFAKKVTEVTAGKAVMQVLGNVSYGILEGKVILLE